MEHSRCRLAWLLLLSLLVSLLSAGCSGGRQTDEPYTRTELGEGGVRLANNFDGYSLDLPAEAAVDGSLAAVRTVITWEGVRLTVYAQDTEGLNGQASYINYSNTFLGEARGITVTDSGERKLGGCNAVYNLWTRRSLSRLEDDLPCYACFDLKYKQDRVYTLFFQYRDAASYASEILPVAESFRTRRVTAAVPAEPRLGEGAGPALDQGAQAVMDTVFAPDAPLTWGLFSPYLPYDGMVAELEQSLDFRFSIYLLYSGFHLTADGKPMIMEMRLYDALTSLCPPGKIPELTLQTYAQDQDLQIYDVLDGLYDGFLHDYAADVAAYGQPVLFRLGNEMNGDWCTYSAFQTCRDPEIYAAFYRYIFDIFRQEGADNAIWVFNPNCRSYPDFKWNSELAYYPGDGYVNVVGLTAYNTGTYYADVGEVWSTFDQLYRDLYDRCLRQYAQPLMITEFACSGIGGDKAAWIDDMFAALPDYPMLKAAVWWNSWDTDWSDPENPVVARPYTLDETEETLAAFRRGLAGS